MRLIYDLLVDGRTVSSDMYYVNYKGRIKPIDWWSREMEMIWYRRREPDQGSCIVPHPPTIKNEADIFIVYVSGIRMCVYIDFIQWRLIARVISLIWRPIVHNNYIIKIYIK